MSTYRTKPQPANVEVVEAVRLTAPLTVCTSSHTAPIPNVVGGWTEQFMDEHPAGTWMVVTPKGQTFLSDADFRERYEEVPATGDSRSDLDGLIERNRARRIGYRKVSGMGGVAYFKEDNSSTPGVPWCPTCERPVCPTRPSGPGAGAAV